MKKPYTAPALLSESFALAEHISNCSPLGTPNHVQGQCTYSLNDAPGILLFTTGVIDEVGSCNLDPGAEGFEEYFGSIGGSAGSGGPFNS